MDIHEDDVYLPAPNEPLFRNPVPSGGFRLVEPGTLLEGRDLECFIRGGSATGELQLVTAPSDGKRFHFPSKEEDDRLLLPIGDVQRWRDPFIQDDGETLFSVFMSLKTEAEILAFAGDNGNLRANLGSWSISDRFALLEPLSWWLEEISRVHNVVEAAETYRKKERMGDYLKRLGQKQWLFSIPGTGYSGTISHLEESERVRFVRGMAGMMTDFLRGCVSPAYVVNTEGRVFSVLRPHNLTAAIWLSFAWGFFGDGPRERIWERCYMSGRYFNRWTTTREGKETTNLSERKRGSEKGLFYHPKEANKERAARSYYKRKRHEEYKKAS